MRRPSLSRTNALLVLIGLLLALQFWVIIYVNGRIEAQQAAIEKTPHQVLREELDRGIALGVQFGSRRDAASPKPPMEKTQPRGDFVVRGVVYDDGIPAAGASITVDQRPISKGLSLEGYPPLPHWELMSDADGQYALETLPEGEYVVRAYRGNAQVARTIHLNAENPFVERNLRMAPAGPLTGVVLTSDGTAVAGATVLPVDMAQDGDDDPHALSFLPETTDADGRFTFHHLPAACRLLAKAPGQPPAISDFLKPDAAPVRIVVGPGGVLRGKTIRADSGEPVPRTTIEAQATAYGLPPMTAEADARGQFQFSDLLPGPYELSIRSDKFTMEGGTLDLHIAAGADAPEIVLRLARTGSLRGRVLAASRNEGVHNIAVAAYTSGPRPVAVAHTDHAGYYQLLGLEPQMYRVDLIALTGDRDDRGPETPYKVTSGATTKGPNFTLPVSRDDLPGG